MRKNKKFEAPQELHEAANRLFRRLVKLEDSEIKPSITNVDFENVQAIVEILSRGRYEHIKTGKDLKECFFQEASGTLGDDMPYMCYDGISVKSESFVRTSEEEKLTSKVLLAESTFYFTLNHPEKEPKRNWFQRLIGKSYYLDMDAEAKLSGMLSISESKETIYRVSEIVHPIFFGDEDYALLKSYSENYMKVR